MSSPRVLLLARWFPPTIGGIEKYLEELYAQLAEDAQVAIVVTHGQTGREGRAYRVHVAPRLTRSLGSKVPVLGIAARAAPLVVRADVIAAGHILMAAPAVVLGRAVRKPTVVHVYGRELNNGRLMRLKTFFLRHADQVVSISEHTTARLRELGVRGDRIVQIPPGVDVEKFSPATHSAFPPLVVLTVGRLNPHSRYKGHDVLAVAVRTLREEGHDVQWRIVGDGPDMAHISDVVRTEKIEKAVTFLGVVSPDELVAEYQRAHILVMPNREGPNGETEGFGMVFTEAQACGTPVLAGTAGGTASAVAEGVGGWRVDGGNAQAVTALLRKLAAEPQELEAAGRRGRDWVVENHAWGARVAELRRVVGELTERGPAAATRMRPWSR